MTRILFLYSEVMGYTVATLRALVARGCHLDVVHWDHRKLSAYQLGEVEGVTFHLRSALDRRSLGDVVRAATPDLVVVSGWMDDAYLRQLRALRHRGIPVVLALDGRWDGRLRQRLAVVFSRLGGRRAWFSHAWIPGACQYDYARRLGFAPNEILQDLYSADVAHFSAIQEYARPIRVSERPRRFLFLGRLEPVKGLDVLWQAWEALGATDHGWHLRLVGNGSLRERASTRADVSVQGFIQPRALPDELARASCFVLPSLDEPWGVALHECAAAGLPLVASSQVGAASAFLISGRNGFTCRAGSVASLTEALRSVMAKTDVELQAMGQASHELARRITPETSADNLLSVLRRY